MHRCIVHHFTSPGESCNDIYAIDRISKKNKISNVFLNIWNLQRTRSPIFSLLFLSEKYLKNQQVTDFWQLVTFSNSQIFSFMECKFVDWINRTEYRKENKSVDETVFRVRITWIPADHRAAFTKKVRHFYDRFSHGFLAKYCLFYPIARDPYPRLHSHFLADRTRAVLSRGISREFICTQQAWFKVIPPTARFM